MKLINAVISLAIAVFLVFAGAIPAQATTSNFSSGPSPAVSVTATLIGYPSSPEDIRSFSVRFYDSVSPYGVLPIPNCSTQTTPCPVSIKVVRNGNEISIVTTNIEKRSGYYFFELGTVLNPPLPALSTPLQAGDVVTVIFEPGAFTVPTTSNYTPNFDFRTTNNNNGNNTFWNPDAPNPNPINATVTSAVLPTSPSAPSATAGNEQATVSIAPNTTGPTPTSYRITATPGSQYCDVVSPATSCTITGLTNGTAYIFSAVAISGNLTSFASSASAAVTPSAPSSAVSPSERLAQTGMSESLFTATGALAVCLILLGGVMVYARKMQRN